MAPRTPSKPRQATRQAPRQQPPPATIGDNSKYREEEERVQLISAIAKATQAMATVETARAPFDAAKKALNQVFTLAKAQNPEFTRKYLEKKMDEMNRSPVENAQAKAMEARHDRWLGILTPEQQKMHLQPGTPQEAKDEVDWEARGFAVGLRGLGPVLPEGIPPRMDQPFMKGHGIGYDQYRAALEANVPGAHRLRAKAEADFKADNPEVDVDAAARKLKNDPAFMARGAAAETEKSTAPAAESQAGTMRSALPAAAADAGFEATPEELAAQKPRQAIVDRREGATSGEEVV